MTDDRTARAKAFIKTPVTHDADACFDANDEVICFAETDNSVCPSDRRVTRAINCLEEIAQALNARPEHSRLEAENKRLREGLERVRVYIECPCEECKQMAAKIGNIEREEKDESR